MRNSNSFNNKSIRKLPNDVMYLLMELKSPPLLIAHLTLVHDVAWKLTNMISNKFPKLYFKHDTVFYGAAMHDIGKCLIQSELQEPGSLHEEIGFKLLLEKGIDTEIANSALNHSSWTGNSNIESLLVSLSDKIWKGKRVPELETLLLEKIISAGYEDKWNTFLVLDGTIEQLALDADERLVYQMNFQI